MPDVSILIINWNTYDLVKQCLRSIHETGQGVDLEIVLVDNGSTDGSIERIAEEERDVRIARAGRNLGFAGGNNFGAGYCSGEFVLLLNSDAFLQPGALQALLAVARQEPQIGLVGARLVNPDGSFQASYTPYPGLAQEFLILSRLGRLTHGSSYPSRGPEAGKPTRIDGYVEGACMLVRRTAYQAVSGLDTRFFMYAEDVDFCYRLAAQGWQIWYQPDARVVHLGGGSSQNRKPQREADLYRSRVQFFHFHYGDGQARLLKAMIYFFTLVKWLGHGLLRFVSGGRRGRQVVSPAGLAAAFHGV